MTSYRYVTPALHGRWRNTRDAALVDAMRAGQAHIDPGRPGKIVMLGGARIEERSREADEADQLPGEAVSGPVRPQPVRSNQAPRAT